MMIIAVIMGNLCQQRQDMLIHLIGPIFVAAGPGIKENYKLQLFPREVDLAPTAAILLGVGIPAQCEGAPIYNMLSEEL